MLVKVSVALTAIKLKQVTKLCVPVESYAFSGIDFDFSGSWPVAALLLTLGSALRNCSATLISFTFGKQTHVILLFRSAVLWSADYRLGRVRVGLCVPNFGAAEYISVTH